MGTLNKECHKQGHDWTGKSYNDFCRRCGELVWNADRDAMSDVKSPCEGPYQNSRDPAYDPRHRWVSKTAPDGHEVTWCSKCKRTPEEIQHEA